MADSLVFVEPRTSEPFLFRDHRVTRTAFPISHGRVITTTACQGRTMRQGVVLDCGRHETGTGKKDDDAWWLELYVMLSRATTARNILTMRAPPFDFFQRGPPNDLRGQLRRFASRTGSCRVEAAALIRKLGFQEFWHDD